MEKFRKFLIIGFAVLLVLCMSMSFTACESGFRLYESTYFIYTVNYDSNEIGILGLTDEGKEQEYLVIPETIDNKKVDYIGCQTGLEMTKIKEKYGDARYSQFQSRNLKKIFIVSDIEMIKGWVIGDFIDNVSPFQAIFYISNVKDTFYRPEVVLFRTKLKGETNLGVWKSEDYVPHNCGFAANVSYYYNYENAPNDGYYWIDNYEYSEQIEFIPDPPLREGYAFNGWYKEPACINAWDFKLDTLPQVQYNQDGLEVYQETELYAKWIEK